MSLLNDALRRAKESQPQNPPAVPPPLPPAKSPPRGGNGWILILAAALFVTAIGLSFSGLIFKSKSVPAMVINAPAPVMAQAAPLQTHSVKTNAPVEAVEPLPKVQGILFDAAHPLAIVDRETVKAGDHAGDYLVKIISRNSVTFQCDDGSLKEIKIGE